MWNELPSTLPFSLLCDARKRVAAAYAAKTVGELQPLLADLPAASRKEWRPAETSTAPAPAPYLPRPERSKGRLARTALRANFRAWLAVVLINVVIWAVVCIGNGELVYFWPIWVAGPWGAVLLAQAVTTRSLDGPHRRELD